MMGILQHKKSNVFFEAIEELSSQHETNKLFKYNAIKELPEFDQALFESFGQGITTKLPFDCIHHAFEYQVKQQPHAIAAHHLESSITYQSLDQKANTLALELIKQGVVEGDHVALFVKRSIPMLVGLLAILKVGASYVPLDAGIAPVTQMEHILKVTNAKLVLSLNEFHDKVPLTVNQTLICLDQFIVDNVQPESNIFRPLPVKSKGKSDSTCFVLFTSGTTGKPNGVKVSHRNLCNILMTQPGNLGMRPGLKVSQILNIAFDMSAWEILGCLSNGATLMIRGSSIEEAVKLADIVIATPSVLASIDLQKVQPINTVAVAGEPCPLTLANKWSAGCAFYNSCGPTETTIINTAQRYYPESKALTIGAPTPNNTVYILDEKMNPCLIGEVGEMWAGGDCVTQGYIGDQALTDSRYKDDPFLGGGRKMFRTRDLGRWTNDGQLEHFGRTDDQVKIRGFRVELDSISTVIESLDDCTRAVTLKYDNRDLITFVSPENCDIENIKHVISKQLPYYCLPKYIIALPVLPLTERGKVDKRLLTEETETLLNKSQDQEAFKC